MSSNSPETDGTDEQTANWSTVSRHVMNSYVEANNALLAAMGLSPATEPMASQSASEDRSAAAPPVTDLPHCEESWKTDRSVESVTDLEVGDHVRFTKPISDADVSAFAQVSGDTNRLHLEEEFAESTRFYGRIAHGTLVAGTISAALARLPGLTIYLSQDLEFHAPVEIDDVVTAEVEIVETLGDGRYRLRTTVSKRPEWTAEVAEDGATDDQTSEGGATVIDGEAVVLVEPAEQ
ncbi:MaoC family dehydratase [Natrarchaeobaculum aegyptiacum]|uniref:Dehydratase n=1 Tax=Natrarchaeobaculum aegyptiacum TaxID=745377 RepID=A0A2Z2HNY8_9EURY|nr:MaoC family dehydratase [Natrarchaeobaculum aegyptiacum]ARS88632.1 dehydratase [Natrarchaeobaculum aegyptiacum]